MRINLLTGHYLPTPELHLSNLTIHNLSNLEHFSILS
jgi:hypothetical protein